MNIQRINELARKAKTVGLTDEEKKEQAILRKEYIQSVVGDLKNQLDNTYVLDKNENKVKVTEYNAKEKAREEQEKEQAKGRKVSQKAACHTPKNKSF